MKAPMPNSQLPNKRATERGRPFDIRERTLGFAVRMLEVSEKLPVTPGGHAVARQLARSGGSIGANVEECDGADSRLDKRRSLIIARREARESRFWLRAIARTWPGVERVQPDVDEASELILILSAMIRKLGAP